MRDWLLAHWRVVAFGALAALLVAGLFVYARTPTKTTTTASVTDGKVDSTYGSATKTVSSAGPVRIVKRKTTPSPAGPVVEETTIDKGPSVTTSDSTVTAKTVETVRVETKTVTVESPRPNWKVSGAARWDSLDLKPSEVAVGVSRRVLGPVSVGVDVASPPDDLRKVRVGAILSVEIP